MQDAHRHHRAVQALDVALDDLDQRRIVLGRGHTQLQVLGLVRGRVIGQILPRLNPALKRIGEPVGVRIGVDQIGRAGKRRGDGLWLERVVGQAQKRILADMHAADIEPVVRGDEAGQNVGFVFRNDDFRLGQAGRRIVEVDRQQLTIGRRFGGNGEQGRTDDIGALDFVVIVDQAIELRRGLRELGFTHDADARFGARAAGKGQRPIGIRADHDARKFARRQRKGRVEPGLGERDVLADGRPENMIGVAQVQHGIEIRR